MPEWQHYGREAEIARLRSYLQLDTPVDQRQFRRIVVSGRRRIGKSELLHQVCAQAPKSNDFLLVEFKEGDSARGHLKQLQAAMAQSRLPDSARNGPKLGRNGEPDDHFVAICDHLLDRGVIIVMDEFQNVDRTGIDGSLKIMIDRRRLLSAPRPTRGQLLVMGSHEQKLAAMLKKTRGLYGRFSSAIHLNPWPLSTIIDVAQTHGLLRHPHQFLTLWTAYGGMPHLWERYVTGPEHDHVRTLDPDSPEWLQAWLHAEYDILCANDQEERFDNSSYLEHNSRLHDILMHMARDPRHKFRVTDFPHEMRRDDESNAQLNMNLHDLKKSSRIVLSYERTMDTSRQKRNPVWIISDNRILFQLHVFPELFYRNYKDEMESQNIPPFDATRMTSRLMTLEGPAFERLIKDWFSECPLRRWGALNIETPARQMRPGDTDTNEIDALARLGDGGAKDVLLAVSAKRDDSAQDSQMTGETGMPARLERLLDRAPNLAHLCPLRREYALLSPVWTLADMARHPDALCLDITTMVDEMQTGWPRLQTLIDRPEPGKTGGMNDPG